MELAQAEQVEAAVERVEAVPVQAEQAGAETDQVKEEVQVESERVQAEQADRVEAARVETDDNIPLKITCLSRLFLIFASPYLRMILLLKGCCRRGWEKAYPLIIWFGESQVYQLYQLYYEYKVYKVYKVYQVYQVYQIYHVHQVYQV